MLKNCKPRLNRTPRNQLVPVRLLPVRQLPLVKPVARPRSNLWGGHKQLILVHEANRQSHSIVALLFLLLSAGVFEPERYCSPSQNVSFAMIDGLPYAGH
jgi:hypothetical protein